MEDPVVVSEPPAPANSDAPVVRVASSVTFDQAANDSLAKAPSKLQPAELQASPSLSTPQAVARVPSRAMESSPSLAKPQSMAQVASRAQVSPDPASTLTTQSSLSRVSSAATGGALAQSMSRMASRGNRVRDPRDDSLDPPLPPSTSSLLKSRSGSKKKPAAKKSTKKKTEAPEVVEPPKEEVVHVPSKPVVKEGRYSAPPLLTEFCLRCIIANFQEHPLILTTARGIPKKYIAKVIDLLPTTLPADIAAHHLRGPESESYWRHCCRVKWQNTDVTMHGCNWKRAYFECMLRSMLEEYTTTKDVAEILNFMNVARDYVFHLQITQLLSHFDVKLIFSHLVKLSGISLSYGARNLGTTFEFDQFGIKPKDCEDLRLALRATHTLSTLALPNNLIDDTLLKTILSGLKENYTVTTLDLSHNKIGDEGVKALCELLQNKDCTITSLDLTNNNIYVNGGKALGKTLQASECLEHLSVRRNRLEDEGGVALFEGLKLNNSMTKLNASGNNLGDEAARVLTELLWVKKPALVSIDVSNNAFGKAGAEHFEGIDRNEFVREFDIRGCDLGKKAEEMVDAWVKRNARNVKSEGKNGGKEGKEGKEAKESKEGKEVKDGKDVKEAKGNGTVNLNVTVNANGNKNETTMKSNGKELAKSDGKSNGDPPPTKNAKGNRK